MPWSTAIQLLGSHVPPGSWMLSPATDLREAHRLVGILSRPQYPFVVGTSVPFFRAFLRVSGRKSMS